MTAYWSNRAAAIACLVSFCVVLAFISLIGVVKNTDKRDTLPLRIHREKMKLAELVQEQGKEVSTQVKQNDSNKSAYKQLIIKMEAENKELKSKLNEEEERIQRALIEKTFVTGLVDSTFEVKGELIDVIIDKYVSSTSPDTQAVKLESAFEVIEFKHNDGVPVPVNGYPFLYVGSVGSSLNREAFVAKNITHVVNWSPSARCNVFEGIEYHCFQGIHGPLDMSKAENLKKLSEGVEVVENARLAGGHLLSHCWWGMNRSVTLLVAYLMKYAGMSIDEATALVAQTRPQAAPYEDVLSLYKANYLST